MRLTFEVFPGNRLDLASIPSEWDLTITCRSQDVDSTLELFERLDRRPMPHVAAGLVQSVDHAEYVAGVVTERVLVIRGDATPRGPFLRASDLIPYFRHCREIRVAGYPEGHPSYPNEAIGDHILLEKQSLGATHVVTQLCFDPRAVIRWAERIHDKGINLPIICGVASPLSMPRLLQFARRCGVSRSLNFASKMCRRDVVKMVTRYDPRPFMEAVYEHVDGFHIYTFNAIKTTRGWVREVTWLEELANQGVLVSGVRAHSGAV